MSWNDKYISKPVSIADVKSAVGSSSNDLATLCTSSAINMWSKYKPIYHSGVSPLTNAQFAEDLGGQSGYRIKYGIKRANGYAVSDLVQSGVIQNRPWTYNRPSGGTSSPYRLSDFASKENSYGYSLYGVCPIDMRLGMTDGYLPIPTNSNDGTDLQFYFLFDNAVNRSGHYWLPEHSISLADMLSSTELGYYPTILLNYKSGNLTGQYCKSSDQTVQNVINNRNYVARVEINTKTLRDTMSSQTSWWAEGAEWSCVFFLSASKMTGQANQLPSSSITRLQYQGTQVLGSPDFFLLKVRRTTWVDDMITLKYTVTIKKNSNYTNHYYVSNIAVVYQTSVARTLNIIVKYTMPTANQNGVSIGYIQGGNGTPMPAPDNRILSHEITDTMQMVAQGSITKNYNSSTYYTPEFVYTNSFPDNAIPIGIDIEFEYGGYAIKRGTTINCYGITSSGSTSSEIKLIG